MAEELVKVRLEGGTYDGREVDAPPPPGTLRFGLTDGERQWTELYVHCLDEPGVMMMVERHDDIEAGG